MRIHTYPVLRSYFWRSFTPFAYSCEPTDPVAFVVVRCGGSAQHVCSGQDSADGSSFRDLGDSVVYGGKARGNKRKNPAPSPTARVTLYPVISSNVHVFALRRSTLHVAQYKRTAVREVTLQIFPDSVSPQHGSTRVDLCAGNWYGRSMRPPQAGRWF